MLSKIKSKLNSQPKKSNIIVFGTNASGKTVYLAMVCHCLAQSDEWRFRFGDFHNIGENTDSNAMTTAQYINERQRELLVDGLFPASTVVQRKPQTLMFNLWNVQNKKLSCQIKTYDVAGEQIRKLWGHQDERDRDPEMLAMFEDLVEDAGGFLFLIDPSHESIFYQVSLYLRIMQFLGERFHERKSEKLPQPIALLITKDDEFHIPEPWDYLSDNNFQIVSNFINNKIHKDKIEAFKCSAVGGIDYKMVDVEVINEIGGKKQRMTEKKNTKVPIHPPQPKGIMGPLVWLIEKMND